MCLDKLLWWPRRTIVNLDISHYQLWLPIYNLRISNYWLRNFSLLASNLEISHFQFLLFCLSISNLFFSQYYGLSISHYTFNRGQILPAHYARDSSRIAAEISACAIVRASTSLACLEQGKRTESVRSVHIYLSWTAVFDSDGVFTMELCSPSFSLRDTCLTVGHHLAPGPPTIAFDRTLKGKGYSCRCNELMQWSSLGPDLKLFCRVIRK